MSEEVKPSPTAVPDPKPEDGDIAHEGLQLMEGFLNTLITQWETEYQSKSKWLWFFRAKVRLAKCARFIASATDGFVVLAERVADAGGGTVKKNLVTNALDRLYTKVVQPNLPLWLKPVGWLIRLVVIRLILGTLIDFCVHKYNAGHWNPEAKEAEVQSLLALAQTGVQAQSVPVWGKQGEWVLFKKA
jgi:hypothetical protein